jgi:hypothetical protein
MPAETVPASSTAATVPPRVTVADQSWSLSRRFDDLQQGLTVALGIVEDLVRSRISSLVIRDDDS